MKMLILPLMALLFFRPSHADEISEAAIKNKFMSIVKDAEVEKMVGETAEFQKCRKENAYDVADKTNVQKNEKLKKATECFEKSLGRDPKQLQELADKLNLENHGLIKSKNIKDITDYLSKKMTKALTGVDLDEKDPAKKIEQMKWENRKIVDHKVFIELYTNQLMKNALFEVSRFCFENLRLDKNQNSDFESHWKTTLDASDKPVPNIASLNDLGDPPFFKVTSTTSGQSALYSDLVSGLTQDKNTPLNPDLYGKFFGYCQASITLLCDQFRQKATADSQAINSKILQKGTSGANACLTVDRLQALRKALKNTKAVADQFNEMGDKKDAFALQMIQNPKLYQRGQQPGEESLDKLTSLSSTEMLEGYNDTRINELEQKCLNAVNDTECDAFLVKGDSLEKTIASVESKINFEKEINKKILTELKNKPKELEEYLTENGHFKLLDDMKTAGPGFDIETELNKVYDARRRAEVEALRLKLGKRQVTEEDYKNVNVQANINTNIQASKEERARLAQVVMFNNIITSQLTLTDSTTKKDVGRNVNGWQKEAVGLAKTGVDQKFFSGLKEIATPQGNKSDNASIVGSEIIDSILGKKSD